MIQQMTPVEIDTELARIYGEVQAAKQRAGERQRQVEYLENRSAWRGPTNYVVLDTKGRYIDAVEATAKAQENILQVAAQADPFDAEFLARGGWTRAFLVNNAGGHVHKSMACSTCFFDTEFCWMVEYSGKDEAQIVEAAGVRACTVCYPSAPVEVLGRPTQMFTPDEVAKAAARVEREAKRAAKDAAKVAVHNYVDYSGPARTKVFNTARGVTNALAAAVGDLACWGGDHPSAPTWQANVGALREALDAAGIAYDYDAIVARQHKKYGRS